MFCFLLAAAVLEIVGRSTVYQHPHADPYDPRNRTGFNHAANVAAMPDGRLMAIWFSGPYEAAVNQLLLASYSSDEGKTWSKAVEFQDFPRRSDFDPALLRDTDRLWLFFSAGRWSRWPFVSNERENVGEKSFQIYSRSTDGKIWTPVTEAATGRGINCRNNGIKLTSGELLLPVTRMRTAGAGVLKSADGGKTWRHVGEVSSPSGQDEPTIVELKSGAVMMFLRTGGGVLWKSVSRDRGETWSAAEKTDIVAARSSHSLFRLKDGRIVLTHNAHAQYRNPITMRVSDDDGATWGQPLTIAELPAGSETDAKLRRQVSYPSVAQLDGGDLVVVWSDIGIGDEAQYGDIRCARVRVK